MNGNEMHGKLNYELCIINYALNYEMCIINYELNYELYQYKKQSEHFTFGYT